MVESINKTFILKKKIVNSKQKIVNQNVLKYNIEKQFQKTKERKKNTCITWPMFQTGRVPD